MEATDRSCLTFALSCYRNFASGIIRPRPLEPAHAVLATTRVALLVPRRSASGRRAQAWTRSPQGNPSEAPDARSSSSRSSDVARMHRPAVTSRGSRLDRARAFPRARIQRNLSNRSVQCAGRPSASDRRGRYPRAAGDGNAGSRDPRGEGDQSCSGQTWPRMDRAVPRARPRDAARGSERARLCPPELEEARAIRRRPRSASSAEWFGGWQDAPSTVRQPSLVPTPHTWLARTGWRRGGLVSSDEGPVGH
jgi:hypothetical protein